MMKARMKALDLLKRKKKFKRKKWTKELKNAQRGIN